MNLTADSISKEAQDLTLGCEIVRRSSTFSVMKKLRTSGLEVRRSSLLGEKVPNLGNGRRLADLQELRNTFCGQALQ